MDWRSQRIQVFKLIYSKWLNQLKQAQAEVDNAPDVFSKAKALEKYEKLKKMSLNQAFFN